MFGTQAWPPLEAMGAGLSESCGGGSLQGTSRDILAQVERLEAKIAKADLDIRQCALAAASDPVAKQRALQLMRRKKTFEEQRQQLLGAQFNVDSLADHEEQARFTLKAISAMQGGRDRMRANQTRMKAEQVDTMLDDVEDLTDEMRAINEAMAQGSSLFELESEYAQLQREVAAQSEPPYAARQRQPEQPSAPYAHSEYAHEYGPPQSSPPYSAEAAHLPPPPPPPRRDAAKAAAGESFADAALQAALAPYGHLPGAGLPGRRHGEWGGQRVPVPA